MVLHKTTTDCAVADFHVVVVKVNCRIYKLLSYDIGGGPIESVILVKYRFHCSTGNSNVE